MPKSFPLLVLAAGLLGACATTGAGTAGAPVAMRTGMALQPPRGFAAMCARQPDLCAAPPAVEPAGRTAPVLPVLTLARPAYLAAEAGEPPLEGEPTRALLNAVNRRVNQHVSQRSDWATYKAQEVWSRPVRVSGVLAGDCEDIAIEKRQQLIEAGVDARKLFLAVVYRRDIGLHVLLIARAAEGDLALDSRSPWIEPWNKVPYTWVKRQLAEDPTRWVMVLPPGEGPAPIYLADASPELKLLNR